MRVLFDFALHIVGKTRVQHIARGRTVAGNGMVGNGFHAIHNIVRCCLTVFRRLGKLAVVCCKRSVVILGDHCLDGSFVVIVRSRYQNGAGGKQQGNHIFHQKFPDIFKTTSKQDTRVPSQVV